MVLGLRFFSKIQEAFKYSNRDALFLSVNKLLFRSFTHSPYLGNLANERADIEDSTPWLVKIMNWELAIWRVLQNMLIKLENNFFNKNAKHLFCHQIAFPGFGYWPRWYADTFRNLSVSVFEGQPRYSNDTEQRNKNLCDIVHYMFNHGGIVPNQ